MSNRSLVELNHDYVPRSNEGLLEWAQAMARYMRSADSRALPRGVTFKHIRHHSDTDPMADHGDPS